MGVIQELADIYHVIDHVTDWLFCKCRASSEATRGLGRDKKSLHASHPFLISVPRNVRCRNLHCVK